MTNLLIRADGTTQIGASLILSCEYIEQVNTSDDVAFGCAAASCISVEVKGALASAVSAGEELTYYQVDESNNRTLIGKFYVDKPTIATKNSYKFEAYDAVSKLDKDLSEWLYGLNTAESFPYTLKNFATMVCTQCGLTFSTTSFLNDNYSVKAFYSDHITGRDLMGLVAELAGGYIKATTSGNIVISWYSSNSTVQIAPRTSGGASGVTRIPYFSGELSYENYTTAQVQRVQIHGDEADIGAIYPTSATGVTYEVSNNILLTSATQEELLTVAQNLYNRIHTFQYKPCTAKVPRNGLLHAGDIVNVVDANGNTFNTIIMKMSFSHDGVTVESTGNNSRDSTAGVASRKYENIFGKMLTVEMSVEGLKLEATALDGRMTTIEATVDGLETTVEALEETSIATVEVQYALSTSSSVAPVSGWSTTAPAWESGKYMWQRTVTTYSDSTTEVPHYTVSDPTCIQGAKGEDGESGVGISSIITQYYLSTSASTQTGGSWSTTAPAWVSGKYIWTRSHITWDDGTASYTTPQLDNTSNDLGSKYSSVKQTADKIEWVVASGTSASDFTLTSRAASLVTGTLTLEARSTEYSGSLSVSSVSGATYDFVITSDGYYTSQNAGHDSSYAVCKVSVNALEACVLTLDCINYAEINYDYGLIGKIDTTLSTSGDDDSSLIFKSFYGQSSSSVVKVAIPIPTGSHFFYVKFRKDASVAQGNDAFKFRKGSSSGNSAILTLNGSGSTLSSTTITFNGLVTFTDLAQSGSTTINGDNITTGTINAIDIWGSKYGVISGSNRGYILMGITSNQYHLNFYSNDTLCGFIAFQNGLLFMGSENHNQFSISSDYVSLGDYFAQAEIIGTSILLNPAAHQGYGAVVGTGTLRPRVVYSSSYPNYLGTSTYKWAALYANTGTIQTSDRNEKKEIDYNVECYLSLFDDLKPISFKYIDGNSGRTHIGFIAQDVEESLSKIGMTNLDFAGFCKDYDESLDRYLYSLRYDEFIALNTLAIKRLEKRLNDLIGGLNNENDNP